jgi:hypothetical protein
LREIASNVFAISFVGENSTTSVPAAMKVVWPGFA